MVRNKPIDSDQPRSVFLSHCPSQRVLDLIANKWTALVIYCLSQGTQRYSELQRQIEGVSQKMLTQTLRNLEQRGLVHRHAYATVPPKVEYSLTPLGKSLLEPMKAMCQWAEAHCDELAAIDASLENPTDPS